MHYYRHTHPTKVHPKPLFNPEKSGCKENPFWINKGELYDSKRCCQKRLGRFALSGGRSRLWSSPRHLCNFQRKKTGCLEPKINLSRDISCQLNSFNSFFGEKFFISFAMPEPFWKWWWVEASAHRSSQIMVFWRGCSNNRYFCHTGWPKKKVIWSKNPVSNTRW